MDSGQVAASEQLQPLAVELSTKLNELNTAVQERIVVGQQKAGHGAALRAAHEKFLQVIAPLVDETGFNLIVGLQSVSEKSAAQDIARRLTDLADKELSSFEAMLRLVSEANLIVGILTEGVDLAADRASESGPRPLCRKQDAPHQGAGGCREGRSQ